jgi:general secretion pathway protein D
MSFAVAALLVMALWAGSGLCLAQAPASQPDTKPVATSSASTDPATTGPAATTSPATAAATEIATTEPTTGPTTEAATTEPSTQPTTRIATTRPTPQPEDPDAPITMNFKEASLRSVLEYLSEAAGLVIIGDPKVEGRISITSRRNISVEEAVKLLDSALREKGYAAIHVERTLKILTIDEAKKEFIPVRVGNIPKEIPLGDAIITQVIPIHNADAVKLKSDLAPLIPSSADVTSNASSNTLIVTGSQTVVRRIVEIVNGIDIQQSVFSQVRVYPLKNANATNTAKLISDIFKEETATPQQPQGGGRRMFMFPGMPQQPAEEKGGKNVKVMVSADDRTNTLVVSASTDVLKVIDSMVEELDKNPENPNAVFIYHLKNAQASNLETVLNNVFGLTGSSSSTNSNANSNNRSNTSSNNTFGGNNSSSGRNSFGSGGSGSFGLNNSSRSNVNNNSNRTGSGGSTAARPGGSNMGNRGQTGTGSTSDLLGQVFVVADTATNSLVVTTASKNFKQVRKVIDDLDRAVPQVLIKVLVCEVTHTNTVDLGVEFSGLNLQGANAVQGLTVGGQVANTSVIEGKGESAGSGFGVGTNTSGGFMFKLDEKYVTAAVHALANVSKLNVLSRPYILTSDNQEATIMVGENDPFITSSQITADGQVINNIQYQAIGIILDVTPHINGQGLVTLDVYPEISSNTGRTVPLNQFASSPIFAQRYAQSRVAIRDGQTIVIGGLMQDQINKSIDKIPFLGDIPLLGLLFQHSNEEKVKTELLIFLTPHVALQPEELKAMTDSEKSGTKIVQDAVEPGAYQNHLKGMGLGASTRPTSGPAAVEDPVHIFDDDPPATQPAGRKYPTSRPAAGEPDAKNP